MNTILLTFNAITNIIILAILAKPYIKNILKYFELKKRLLNLIKLTNDNKRNINKLDKQISKLEDDIVYMEFNNDEEVENPDSEKCEPEHVKHVPRSIFPVHWTERIIGENICNTFDNVYDFIDYLTEDNLEIIDIANKKLRKVKHLEEINCHGKPTVLITFEDGKEAVFFPFLFAKIIWPDKEE